MKFLIATLLFLCYFSMFGAEAYKDAPDSVEAVPVPKFIDLNKADFAEAPDQHTVESGDTLWDLTEKYLKSPWYWPKVWSINPQIANPHLIFPGDIVLFKGSGEIVPDFNDVPGDDEELARSGKTLDGTPDSYKDYVQLGGKYKIIKYTGVNDTVFDVTRKGFISQEKLGETAEIIGSHHEKELLATEDSCYIKIDNFSASIGDYVQFFRTIEEVIHPETGEPAGKRIEIMGKGKVLSINESNIATLKIVKSFDAISRGDKIRAWENNLLNIPIKETDVKVKATILTSYDPVVHLGDGHIIYLDKGSKSGLEVGHMLSVFKKGDGIRAIEEKEESTKLPYELVGEVVILKVEDNTSAAIITKSLVNIIKGDKVSSGDLN